MDGVIMPIQGYLKSYTEIDPVFGTHVSGTELLQQTLIIGMLFMDGN